jgi:hypothetical protein
MNSEISATISGWSKSLNIADETIISRLVKSGYKIKPRALVPARKVFEALIDERARTKSAIEAELLRKERRENDEAEKNLVVISEAEKKIWNDLLAPLKVEVELIADKIAALCNPDCPELAHKQLTAWSEQTKKQILQSYQNKTK